jgi:hypothetical protein
VSDGTTAAISAAVKAVVRISFIKPSLTEWPDVASISPEPCAHIDLAQSRRGSPARRIAANGGEAAGTVAEVRQLINYRGSRLKRPVHPAPQPSKPECDDDCSIRLALNYIPEGVCKGITCPICSPVCRIALRQIAGDACDPLFIRTVLRHVHTETE